MCIQARAMHAIIHMEFTISRRFRAFGWQRQWQSMKIIRRALLSWENFHMNYNKIKIYLTKKLKISNILIMKYWYIYRIAKIFRQKGQSVEFDFAKYFFFISIKFSHLFVFYNIDVYVYVCECEAWTREKKALSIFYSTISQGFRMRWLSLWITLEKSKSDYYTCASLVIVNRGLSLLRLLRFNSYNQSLNVNRRFK